MEFFFNNKTYKINQTLLYESLNEDDSNSNSASKQDPVNVIEQNKDNKDFINGLIDIIGGEVNDTDTNDTSNNINTDQINNLNKLQNLIGSFNL